MGSSLSDVRWGTVAGAVAAALGILVLAYLGAMLLFQRRLLYPRPSVPSVSARPDDSRQVWLATPDGKVEAWYLPPRGPTSEPAPAIIFFHGNGELIDDQPDQFDEPRGAGIGVLLVEFPGYGRSAGEPSQQSITRAVLAAYAFTQTEASIDPNRIVAYGRSLGGGAAAVLAAERPTSALILESTFTSVRSFAHQFWAPEFAVLDPFDTLEIVRDYQGPVLVLHGDRDAIIPKSHGEVLARAAPRSELVILPCGHNDCIRPWKKIHAFLRGAGVSLAPEAQR